jgi:hypothetical protein
VTKNLMFDSLTLILAAYIKRTSTGGIKLILTFILSRGGVGNGQIFVDFISMN